MSKEGFMWMYKSTYQDREIANKEVDDKKEDINKETKKSNSDYTYDKWDRELEKIRKESEERYEKRKHDLLLDMFEDYWEKEGDFETLNLLKSDGFTLEEAIRFGQEIFSSEEFSMDAIERVYGVDENPYNSGYTD